MRDRIEHNVAQTTPKTRTTTIVAGLTLVVGCLSGSYTLADRDILFSGTGPDDQHGWVVLGTSDVNGDGIDDVMTTAPAVSGDRLGIYFGPIPSGTIVGTPDVTFTGMVGSEAGWMATTGDVTGNGSVDLVVGSPASAGGEVFIVQGPLLAGAAFTPADAWVTLTGGVGYDGYDLALGDYNGDGSLDIATANCGGNVYVFNGPLSFAAPTVLDQPSMSSTELTGDVRDLFACRIANGGDLNATGSDTLVVSAEGAIWMDRFGVSHGGAGIVYLFDNLPLGTYEADSIADARIGGTKMALLAGASLAGGGDFNLDGTPDLLIGAPSWFCLREKDIGRGCTDPMATGQVALFLGGALAGDYDLDEGALLIDSSTPDGLFGFSVDWADLNHDSYDDIVVGAPGMSKAFVYYSNDGDPGAPMPSYSETSWAGGDGAVITSAREDAAFGFSISGSSDIDNDGIEDLLIGDPGMLWFGVPRGQVGEAYVYLGDDTLTGSRYSAP